MHLVHYAPDRGAVVVGPLELCWLVLRDGRLAWWWQRADGRLVRAVVAGEA